MHPIRYFKPWRMWRRHELEPTADVVIVGGGAHGLAIAYDLAKRGIRKVAVLEKSYIGAGGSGRNTTIIRANYRTPEGVAFYKESARLYAQLGRELDYNLLFSQQGHLTLAHAERAVNVAHERAEVNRLLGVDSRVIYPDEIAKLCPPLDLSDRPEFPIMAALYHPPGGVIRHDAVVWAYARQADHLGVRIHEDTEVTGIMVEGARVTGVRTSRGEISTNVVVSATAGWTSEITRIPRVDRPPLARTAAGSCARQGNAGVGWPVRRDPRLLPDHGPHGGRRVPARRRLGDVRVQGHADRGRHDGRADRRRTGAGAHRALRALAILGTQARVGDRRRGGLALIPLHLARCNDGCGHGRLRMRSLAVPGWAFGCGSSRSRRNSFEVMVQAHPHA